MSNRISPWEANISLNESNSLVFEFAKPPIHHNGMEYTGFTVKYYYSWGKGIR